VNQCVVGPRGMALFEHRCVTGEVMPPLKTKKDFVKVFQIKLNCASDGYGPDSCYNAFVRIF